MRLEHPKSGKIEQGALFNCAFVPGYEDCPCHGIVVTARCDIEHEKYSVINYLPVVSFVDWSKRDMCYLLAKRMHKSVRSFIYSALSQKKVSKYIQDTFPVRDIILKETNGKEQNSLLAKLAHLELIETVMSLGGRFAAQRNDLIQVDSKQCETLIRELIQGKLAEYYFLDAADIYDRSPHGHVVLLRNMQMLNCDIMNAIVAGLKCEQATADASLRSTLTFDHEPICMITGVLRTPDIEHLAQQFANLFVRIGLEDHEQQTIEHHQKLAKG
jgi:hypothetical protein